MKCAPVILMTYNRPDHTRKVLDALRKAGVEDLYIFCDGARKESDQKAIDETRAIVDEISWTAPVVVKRDENFGLARSIVEGVDQVFEKYDRVILLEDDCVPGAHFFEFMNESFERYESNEHVFGISGYSVPVPDSIRSAYPYDLYFFPRIGSWGWGTWKRAWAKREQDLGALFQKCIREGIDLFQGGTDVPDLINKYLTGELKDVWTLHWILSVYLHRGFYIYPTVSHVENIGMDGSGMHCGPTEHFKTPLATATPARFPDDVVLNREIFLNFRKFYDLPGKQDPALAFDALSAALESTISVSAPKEELQKPVVRSEYSEAPVKILHIVQWLSKGGATRAMMGAAKYSSETGNYIHSVVSLLPPDPDACVLARESGMTVVESQSEEVIRRLMEDSDIVQLQWWNSPEMDRFLRSPLPATRLMAWLHVAGDGAPQIITRELVDYLDFVLAGSPYTYENPAIQSLPLADRMRRCDMAYDATDFARLDGIQAREHSGFNVGYIGTVDFVKMHPNYVQMSAAIDIPDVRFVVCGTGREDLVRAQVEELEATDRFDIKGHVENIKAELELFDVYGYPLCENTYAAAELNLQEAMFAGVPPVVFPYGGVKLLVFDGFTGLVVRSELEYKEAIEYLYHNPGERARLGANAHDYAIQIFGSRNSAKVMNSVFERLMKEPKRKRVWGYHTGQLKLQDQVEYEVLAKEAGEVVPHLRFIQSLGDSGEDFLVSMAAEDIRETLSAEERIINSSVLLRQGGVEAYAAAYPNDIYLRFWYALTLMERNEEWTIEKAIVELATLVDSGFNHWRMFWYLALACRRAGKLDAAKKALEQVREAFPDFDSIAPVALDLE